MDKRAKRLSEFKEWIRIFLDYHQQQKRKTYKFIDNAAEILNAMYWRYIEHYIRPIISSRAEDESPESRISRFKIISATELCIIDVQPVLTESDDKTEGRMINAEFAYFVALEILLVFSETKISDDAISLVSEYKEEIPDIDTSEILTIKKEHLQWLTHIDADVSLPIISNSQTWRFFYMTLLAVEGKLPQKTQS